MGDGLFILYKRTEKYLYQEGENRKTKVFSGWFYQVIIKNHRRMKLADNK